MKIFNRLHTTLVIFLLIICTVVIHHLRMDLSLWDPRQIKWLWQTDWAVQYLGWLFFRHQDWHWPLGHLSHYIHPFGASIGTTDSIPIAAYFFKIIAPLLPEDFQYFSWWYALSIFLSGYFGYKIIHTHCSKTYSFIAALFFMTAPPMMGRNHHMALSAQWILLAFYNLYQNWAMKDQNKIKLHSSFWLSWVLIVFLSSSLHPYLWAMIVTLSMALFFSLWFFSKHKAVSAFVFILAVGSSFFGLWANGYFMIGDTTNVGFGYYSADLLSFFHPNDLPVLLGNIGHGSGQYEGYSYLGLGVMLIILANLFFFLKNKSKKINYNKIYLPLVITVIALWIFALASPITFAGKEIINIDFLYAPFKVLTHTFRSSGRFVWPLYYALLIWTLSRFYFHFKKNHATLWLSLICLVQLIDINRIVDYPRSPDIVYNPQPMIDLRAFIGNKVIENLYVVYSIAGELCPRKTFHWEGWQYYPLLEMAGKNNWNINIGSASRYPFSKIIENCENQLHQLEESKIKKKTLYVFTPEAFELFKPLLKKNLDCKSLSQMAACYPHH